MKKIQVSTSFKKYVFSEESLVVVVQADNVDLHITGKDSMIINNGKSNTIHVNGAGTVIKSMSDSSSIISNGDNSIVISKGNNDHLVVSGDFSKIVSTGDSARIYCLGVESTVVSEGKNAQITSEGEYSVVKAKKDSFISCVLYKSLITESIMSRTARVDGKEIKADTFYTTNRGVFVEVQS